MTSYGSNNKISIYLSCLWDIIGLLKDTFNQRACLWLGEQLVIEHNTSEKKVVDKLQRQRQDIQLLKPIMGNDQYVGDGQIEPD